MSVLLAISRALLRLNSCWASQITLLDMRLLTLILLFGIALGAHATTFSIPGAGISFDAPEGFTPLSKDEIAIKFPSSRAPSGVIGNARRTTTIAYELKQDKLAPEQLGEGKDAFEQLFERIIPGLEWKARAIVQFQGQRWIQLEMSSRAVDTDIHNIMLVTSRNGRMLIFNFNSTKSEFPSLESVLRESIRSIKVIRK